MQDAEPTGAESERCRSFGAPSLPCVAVDCSCGLDPSSATALGEASVNLPTDDHRPEQRINAIQTRAKCLSPVFGTPTPHTWRARRLFRGGGAPRRGLPMRSLAASARPRWIGGAMFTQAVRLVHSRGPEPSPWHNPGGGSLFRPGEWGGEAAAPEANLTRILRIREATPEERPLQGHRCSGQS